MSAPSNSEVSKKLRAAIRAKLEELGVYVDDELPDYIMVMIANKKEKKQMKDDLHLFLSKNTDAFVEWLFDIFHRLQSAPPVISAPTTSSNTTSANPVKKEKKTKKKTTTSDSKKIEKKDGDKPKKRVEGSVKSSTDKEKERKEKKEADRRDIERANREDRERREREERERRERDEKREREEKEKKERERERKEREHRDREREKEREREREREKERRKEKEQQQIQAQREKEKETEAKRRTIRRALSPDAPVPSAAERRQIAANNERNDHVAKKRPTTQVTITRTVSPPPVTVASRVVVKRKIKSQPAPKAGTANLFMKAMNAASVSAGYGGGPKSRKRAATSAQDDLPQFSDEDEFANGEDENDDHEEEEKETIHPRKKPNLTRTTTTTSAPLKRRVVQSTDVVEKKEPRFTITFGGKEKRALKRGARDTEDEDEKDEVRVAPREIAVSSKRKRTIAARVTREDDDDDDEKDDGAMNISVSPPHKHSSPSNWDGHINLNDEDETSDEEAAIDAVLAATRAPRLHSRNDEDHIPPTHQLSRGNSYYELYNPQQPDITPILPTKQQPQYVPTPLSHSYQPTSTVQSNKVYERCRFYPNCKEGDDCIYQHPAPKLCINFPKCSFGSRCLYTHPKCRFDAACTNAACAYTHTVPKKPVATTAVVRAPLPSVPTTSVSTTAAAPVTPSVSTESTNGVAAKNGPDVPLVAAATVSPTKPPVSSTLMSAIPCRFAARCTNPVCAYKHPKECRYGQTCRNADCYFYHPPASRAASAQVAAPVVPAPVVAAHPAAVGGANKFKWSASAVKT